jgi:hypothetical protein
MENLDASKPESFLKLDRTVSVVHVVILVIWLKIRQANNEKGFSETVVRV